MKPKRVKSSPAFAGWMFTAKVKQIGPDRVVFVGDCGSGEFSILSDQKDFEGLRVGMIVTFNVDEP